MFFSKDKFTGKILSYKEFCLSESFRPLYIEYGTDLKNEEWYSDDEHFWTFVKYEKYYYCVVIDVYGDVGFATSDIFDKSIFSKWNGITDTFDFDERKTSSASKVFCYAMYVILQGLKEFNIREFKFSGQHAALGKIYKTVVSKNKYFLDSLKKEGYYFDREEDDEFYFKLK
jgi:hypothetical protein